jgi:hypothetical protein
MRTHLRFSLIAGAVVVAPATSIAQQIVVGPNVQISGARARDAHSEPVIASDPNHAERLIAASHISHHDTVGTKSIAYVSFDTGKTWMVSLDKRDSTITADAAVAYGVDGSALFATLARWGMYRSRDGGKTWDPPTKTPPAYGWDREYLIADFSPGKYHGRVYMNSTVSVPWVSDSSPPGFGGNQKENAVALFTSTDGGTKYGNPIVRLVPRPEGILGMSESVVLSDGTLMTLYGHRKPVANAAPGGGGGGRGGLAARTPLPAANYWLDVITSTDGGESWNTGKSHRRLLDESPAVGRRGDSDIAVDPGSSHFKDRVYVVWSDFRSGRLEVMLSYSSDKGKTWSREQIINDDRAAPDPLLNGPDNVTPVVAVNKDGVVAVAWYDRRDFEDNISWNIRMRASLDGGETWTPSVKVTDKGSVFGNATETWNAQAGGGGGGGRGRGGGADTARSGGAVVSLSGRLSYANFTFAPGHNGAFVADAAGGFHPAWIDYRNGMAQLWTATVWVKGPVAVNGGGDLAGLSNLSSRVALETINTSYDRQTNRLTFKTVLRNTSKTDTIRGPLKARVLVLTSENARSIEIANPDNQGPRCRRGLGLHVAAQEWHAAPDSMSTPKELVFQLTGVSRFRDGTELRLGFVNMDAKILGPPLRPRGGARAAPN